MHGKQDLLATFWVRLNSVCESNSKSDLLLKLKLITANQSTIVQPYNTDPDLCSQHKLSDRLGIYSLTFVHQDCCQVIEHHVLLGVLGVPCQLCRPPDVGVCLLVVSLSVQHRRQVIHQHHTLHQEGKGKLVEQSGAAEAPHSFPVPLGKAAFPREGFSKEVPCVSVSACSSFLAGNQPQAVLAMSDVTRAAPGLLQLSLSFPRVQLLLYKSPVDESLPEHHLISAEPSHTFFVLLGAR